MSEDFYGTPGTCGVCKVIGVRTVLLLEDDNFHGCYACRGCYVAAMTSSGEAS